jgi:hypothetical protein
MHFLFPSDPIDPRRPDETFREQADEVRKLGMGVSIVTLEELGEETCRLRGPIPADATVVYRGWMLTPTEYERLARLIRSHGAVPLISPEDYLLCHYLPNWYPLISEFTAETRIFSANADLAKELRTLGWKKFFIKDFVKSLKTSIGSVIADPEDITAVVSEMQRFRGAIEGGVCVRQFEDFVPNSERRYFVIGGRPHAALGAPPKLAFECAQRVHSPFFSIDIALNSKGIDRVVEIGDGQVSDLVGWDAAGFAKLWNDDPLSRRIN